MRCKIVMHLFNKSSPFVFPLEMFNLKLNWLTVWPDFWKILTRKFLTKVYQIFDDFRSYFENENF